MRRQIVAAVAAAALALGACSDGDEPEAQPSATEAGTFAQGRFDQLPRFPRSEPAGPAETTDRSVVRSYIAENATPQAVLEFYEDSLVDWEAVQEPTQIGEGSTYRGVWQDGDLELTVSATDAPALSGGEDARTQYSLSLESAQ